MPDPALLVAMAQIEIQRAAAAVDIDIKRRNARTDMAIAAFKARRWAEIESLKPMQKPFSSHRRRREDVHNTGRADQPNRASSIVWNVQNTL